MKQSTIEKATLLKNMATDYPDEVKSDKWRNLYFDTEGCAHAGEKIFDSEEVAVEGITYFSEALKTCYTYFLDGTCLSKKMGLPELHPDKKMKMFSHAIPMPEKE